MAKLVVEFDTETKMLTVKKDGAEVNNVTDVSGFKMWKEEEDEEDKFTMRVTTKEESDDMVTYTILSANEAVHEKVTAIEDAFLNHFRGIL